MSITKQEQETNIVAIKESYLPKKSISNSDFIVFALDNTDKFIGVNYPDRVKFLKDNGYQLTRKNLIDSSLSTKPKKKK